MQRKLGVIVACLLVISTFLVLPVKASASVTWSPATNPSYQTAISPTYSTFTATFDFSNFVYGSAPYCHAYVWDSSHTYGWEIRITSVSDTLREYFNGHVLVTLTGHPTTVTLTFDGTTLTCNGQAVNDTVSPSIDSINSTNPLSVFDGERGALDTAGTLSIVFSSYSPPPTPTPTASPTPTPTPMPTPTATSTPTPTPTATPTPTVYSTTSGDFNDSNYFIFDQTLSSSIDTSNPFTIAVHFQNMPNASAVNSGWNQCYRLWFEGTADVFTVEFDVVNAYHSDIITQTGNLTQFRNNVGTLVVNGGLYLANPITHNDTVTLTGNGSQLSVYFGSTLVGTDTMSSSVITKIETTGFEMLAPDISPPVSGSGATVSIYNSVIDPAPSSTPTPTSHHGGGGSQPTYAPTSTPSSTPSQSPNSSGSPVLPVTNATKITATEIFAVTVLIALSVASWMFLASRRRR